MSDNAKKVHPSSPDVSELNNHKYSQFQQDLKFYSLHMDWKVDIFLLLTLSKHGFIGLIVKINSLKVFSPSI